MTIEELSQSIAEEIADYVYTSDGTPEEDRKAFSKIVQKALEYAIDEEEIGLIEGEEVLYKTSEEYEEEFPNGILDCDEGQGEYA